jgi:cytochrome c553
MPARSIASATAASELASAARNERRRLRLPRQAAGIVAAALAAALLSGAVAAQSVGTSGATAKPAPARTAKAAASRPAAAASASASDAGAYKERFASVCAACHGANGRSEMPGTPALAGQHGFYAITQLFLFREGRRSNEAMTAIAKGMTDTDLRGFAAVIDALPPVPPPPATPPDTARMTKGRELARQHKCVFCHGEDLSGGQQVPRIGGQREEYLRETLRGFKSGQRPGYTQAMIEAVSQVTVDELDTLAYYAARVPVVGAATAAAGASGPAPPGSR